MNATELISLVAVAVSLGGWLITFGSVSGRLTSLEGQVARLYDVALELKGGKSR